MKAKWYFWMLAAVMLTAIGFLTYIIVITQEFSWYFVTSELLVTVVLILLAVLYAKVVKPMQTIGNGMDLLREQDFSSRLGYVGQKDADRVVEIFNKMMEQLKNERLHVREQNEFLDLLVKSSPMGLIVLDFDGQVSNANPAACDIFGADAALRLPQALSSLETGESSTIRTDDGNVFKCSCAYFMDRGFQRKFYIIEQMTMELLKAEKKAYGQVIRMLAHEVNNSMAGVTSSLNTAGDIFESSLQAGGKQIGASDMADIRELLAICSDRCISLSRFISAYVNVVKIPEPQFEDISLNDFVNNRLRFWESICAVSGKSVTIKTELSPSAGTVRMDSVLMEQVIVNIVKNAAEAIADNTDDGRIVIRTSGGNSDAEGQRLSISNNGKPIPEDAADKLFTPFFSTKINGQGIGLTLIRDILIKHSFRFSLRTCPDGWTRFVISF